MALILICRTRLRDGDWMLGWTMQVISTSCSDHTDRRPSTVERRCASGAHSLPIFIFCTQQQRSQAQSGKSSTKGPDDSKEAEAEAEAGGGSRKIKSHQHN